MFSIPSNQTMVGVIMGPDIGNDSVGSATKWLTSFQTWAGWKARPAGGAYCYPNYDNSSWAFKTFRGAGPMCWGSQIIPNDAGQWAIARKPSASEITTLMTNVRAGKLDPRWHQLATDMVANGQTDGIYRTGFEGDGNWFTGSAAQIGEANYAEIMERHLGVMMSVSGWNFLPEWNFDVTAARMNGMDPDKAWCKNHIGVVGMDLYDQGAYHGGGYTAANHDLVWQKDLLPRLNNQLAFAQKHGLRLGFTEFGPMWKNDGHGGGDSRYFLDRFADWCLANVPSHIFLFNGVNLPGDECRVAKPVGDLTKPTYQFTDNDRMKTAGAAGVKARFDPTFFVNIVPPTPANPPVMFTQAQVNAAVAAAVAPLNVKVAGLTQQVNSTMTALTAANTSVTSAQAALAAANVHIAASDAQVGTLTGQLSDADDHLTSANTQINDLQATIAKVKADLGIS